MDRTAVDPQTRRTAQTKRTAVDPQTGRIFILKTEDWRAITFAVLSIVYLLLLLAFFLWQLFDIAVGHVYLLPHLAGYLDNSVLASPSTRLIAFAFLGGGIGGIVNEIRSFLYWHCEIKAFGPHFIWKSISSPWLGATLALVVYATIQGGIAVFTGSASSDTPAASAGLSALSVGALTGYGSRKVAVWLDAQVNRLFSVTGTPSIEVPDLSGMTKDEAQKALERADLQIGKVTTAPADDANIDKVIDQSPRAGEALQSKEKVDTTIGIKKTGVDGVSPAGS